MRGVVIGVLAVALIGCGGEKKTAAKPKAREAPEVVYLYRVQGDDPLPDSVSLRADGTADVQRGGGHGGFRTVKMELTRAELARAERLAKRAPWKALDGHTVEPGGFGGWDNDMRYMLRRGSARVTVSDSDMPRRIRPLIRTLDDIIEGVTGRQITKPQLHSSISGTIAP